jgi:HEXXH motif-containing protein
MPKTTAGIDAALADLGSGYGTQASVAFLKNGLLQGRLILLRTLITEATARHAHDADAAGLAAAYQRLGELQLERGADVVELLMYPHTGSWLARSLRRVYADDEADDTSEKVPLWADLGYLGWLAATGSIASGTEGSMRLVVRDGAVMLPRIGLARLSLEHEHGHCELHWTAHGALTLQWGAHQITIPSHHDHHTQAHPAWLPLRRLASATTPADRTADHAVFLDDIDPFRDFDDPYITHVLTTPPPRLTDTEAATWQRNFAGAWEVLARDYDRHLAPMRSDLRAIIPLTAKPIATGASNTSCDGYGGVYTTAPAGPHQLALTLIHEFQHAKFTLLTDQVKLYDPDPACRFYAPWRDDPRPILGLLHGIYAHAGVTDFWRVHRRVDGRESMQAHVEFERWRVQVQAAIAVAIDSKLLTAEGEQFLVTLDDGMSRWRAEEVPELARRIASDSSVAHLAFWRVRNLRPTPTGIAELADRWLARAAPSKSLPESSLVGQERIPAAYRDLNLLKHLNALGKPGSTGLPGAQQSTGDLAYVAGDISRAAELYVRELRDDPTHPQPWAGLALTLPSLHPDVDFSVLHERTEVVARLAQAIQAREAGSGAGATNREFVDIVAIVRWLTLSGRAR